jgi:hypothetical protein
MIESCAVIIWMRFNRLRIWFSKNSSSHSNKLEVSINGEEFLEKSRE